MMTEKIVPGAYSEKEIVEWFGSRELADKVNAEGYKINANQRFNILRAAAKFARVDYDKKRGYKISAVHVPFLPREDAYYWCQLLANKHLPLGLALLSYLVDNKEYAGKEFSLAYKVGFLKSGYFYGGEDKTLLSIMRNVRAGFIRHIEGVMMQMRRVGLIDYGEDHLMFKKRIDGREIVFQATEPQVDWFESQVEMTRNEFHVKDGENIPAIYKKEYEKRLWRKLSYVDGLIDYYYAPTVVIGNCQMAADFLAVYDI